MEEGDWMQQLILVRHGETQYNEKGCYCGWEDSPLTDKGLEDVQQILKQLEGEELDLIISSDLNRTIKTANMINEFHKTERLIDKDLREINFGVWEGLNYEEISSQYPLECENWHRDWIEYRIPQGESLRQMYERVTNSIDIHIQSNPNKSILVVSHGGSTRAILAHLIGRGIEDYWKYKINHGGITKIEISAGFPVLTALNA